MQVTSCDEFIEMNNFISWAQCESTTCKFFMLDDPSPYHQFPTVWHHPEDLLNLLQDTVSIPLCGKNCAISFITQNLFVWWYHGKDGWCWSSNWSMWTDEKGGQVLWGFSLWWPWVDLSLSATCHRRQLALRPQAAALCPGRGCPWMMWRTMIGLSTVTMRKSFNDPYSWEGFAVSPIDLCERWYRIFLYKLSLFHAFF